MLEDNKYYPVLHVTHSYAERPDWGSALDEDAVYQEAEDLFGPVLIRDRDPMLKSYLLWQKGVNDRILNSLLRANDANRDVPHKTAQVRRKDLLIRKALEYFDRV